MSSGQVSIDNNEYNCYYLSTTYPAAIHPNFWDFFRYMDIKKALEYSLTFFRNNTLKTRIENFKDLSDLVANVIQGESKKAPLSKNIFTTTFSNPSISQLRDEVNLHLEDSSNVFLGCEFWSGPGKESDAITNQAVIIEMKST